MAHSLRSRITALAAGSFAALALSMAAGQAKADCSSMLKPFVSWSKQSNSKASYPVYVTISTHFVGKDQGYGKPNPVFFTFGGVGADAAKGPDVLVGKSIPLRSSNSDFAPNGKSTVDFSITADGMMTYVEKLNGQPVGGMPPVKLQGTCTGGLITALNGTKEWAVGFSTGPQMTILQ